MSDKLTDYEKVSIYPLNPDVQEKLLRVQRECVFNWSTREGWPLGVIMSCLWTRGRMWLTAGVHRHRISAVRRDPRVSVVVTSTGTELGMGKTVTIKGKCIVHEDRETKDWFYPEFSQHMYGEGEAAESFQKRLDSPLRVVLEIVPEKYITYDGMKMFAHTAGQLDESELGEPKSSDSERLARELDRRGLVGE
jgi:general stress protein 26